MRKLLAPLSLLFMAWTVLPPAPAIAQEEEEDGDLVQIIVFDVAPADRAVFKSGVEKYVEAAASAGLGQEFGWHFWSHDRGYSLIWPIDSFAEFDDPQFEASFEGTPGEALRDEAQAIINSIQYSSQSQINETVPDWTYDPATPMAERAKAAFVWTEWPKNGMQDEYGEMVEGWVAMMEQMNYPYRVLAHRTRIGDGGVSFVFFVDGLDKFHSDATWTDLIKAADLEDAMEELEERNFDLIKRYETMTATYQLEMSYWPDGET
jgi:hypothetical protein